IVASARRRLNELPSAVGQGVPREDPLLDRLACDQVLADQPWDALAAEAVIPRPLRVDDRSRPVATDAQAADLGAVTGIWPGGQPRVLQRLLERFPGGMTGLRRAAVRPGAEKDMAMITADAELFGDGLQFQADVVHGRLPRGPRSPRSAVASWRRRTISAKRSTLDVAATISSQSTQPSGSTLKTAARKGTLTISTCTRATVPAIARNVGLPSKPCRPLIWGTSDRQLIWFHTWKNT